MLNSDFVAKENLPAEFKTTLISRNITVLGRRTSIRLEPEMWLALKEISIRERCSTHDICSLVNVRKNPRSSLTAAIRTFLMLYFRAAATEEGHQKAGHGNFERMMQRAKVPSQVMPSAVKRKNYQAVVSSSSIEPDLASLQGAL